MQLEKYFEKVIRLVLCFCAFSLLLIFVSPNRVIAAELGQSGLKCLQVITEDGASGKEKSYFVDSVWTGARVDFSAVKRSHKIYAAYYDKNRLLTVAEVDLKARTNCQLQLASRFVGWDSHNSTTLAFAPDGSLHLAANMHASPLVYGHTDSSGDLGTLRLMPMISRDEQRATYPTFLSNGKDPLLFLYRSGQSGSGKWLANRWWNGRWSRVSDVFSGVDRSGPTSAYPTEVEQDASGFYHMAVVWRRSPDVQTNYAISYARTRDFISWYGSENRRVLSPLNVDTADLIEAPGQRSGLLNNAKLVLSSTGKQLVVYTRYASDGKNRIYAAKPTQGRWEIKEIAAAANRIEVAGGGTITGAPSFTVQSLGDEANIGFAFPGGPKGYVNLNFDSFNVHSAGKAAPALPEPSTAIDLEGLESGVSVMRPIIDDSKSLVGWLFWSAQAPNRDVARLCSDATPHACAPPPKPLRFIVIDENRK